MKLEYSVSGIKTLIIICLSIDIYTFINRLKTYHIYFAQ